MAFRVVETAERDGARSLPLLLVKTLQASAPLPFVFSCFRDPPLFHPNRAGPSAAPPAASGKRKKPTLLTKTSPADGKARKKREDRENTTARKTSRRASGCVDSARLLIRFCRKRPPWRSGSWRRRNGTEPGPYRFCSSKPSRRPPLSLSCSRAFVILPSSIPTEQDRVQPPGSKRKTEEINSVDENVSGWREGRERLDYSASPRSC